MIMDADTLEHRQKLNSQGYWEIPPGLDTTNFDFSWRPYVYDRPYIHQFGTQHQRTGGPRWVVPEAEGVKYHNHQRAVALPQRERFNVLVNTDVYDVDFDWSWHPDDTEPPLIWTFGNQFLSGEVMPTVQYVVDDATDRKFVGDIAATLCSKSEHWVELQRIDSRWDRSWAPHPYEPPYIYVWGNQYLDAETMPTVEYHQPGATDRKYMSDRRAKLVGDPDNWKVYDEHIHPAQIDYTWTPHPHEPPWIYTWGNKWVPGEVAPTVEYVVPGATQRKYMGDEIETEPHHERWTVLRPIQEDSFDFSFRPNPYEQPYIYVWGNQHYSAEVMPTVEYAVPGATERKYMDHGHPQLAVNTDRWVQHYLVNSAQFDLSWVPHPHDPPYIYVWGNRWIPGTLQPTLEYVVPGATERKYMHDDVPLLPDMSRWVVNVPVDQSFDFTWLPDPREPAYIYVWGNQWNSAVDEPTVEYHVPGATQHKYMDQSVTVLPDFDKWRTLIEVVDFDYSWRPNPRDPAYIYVWGNQWNSAVDEPTVEYHTPGATERKYMSETVTVTANMTNWVIHDDIEDFDFSWRPNPRDPAYIYRWSNQWVDATLRPTLEYIVPGATEVKYMSDIVKVLPQTERWRINSEVTDFDFTWRPDPREPAMIYVWGNQWNSAVDEPTIEYHTPGATDRKYMDDSVTVVPQMDRWILHDDITDFDLSWRPNPQDPPYIYVWGNPHYSGEVQPTLEYYTPGATDRKYMPEPVKLDRGQNWRTLMPVDDSFDYSWRPHPHDPPYIYVWGNQHYGATEQPTVEYHAPGATDRKYVTDSVATLLPDQEHWRTLVGDVDFDWSWRPNPNDPLYIYVWGNQHWSVDIQPTLEYHTPGATQRKYMTDRVAKLKRTDINWVRLLDNVQFDTSWVPDPREPAYIYVWGNQHWSVDIQPTIEYHTPGATERKYITDKVAKLRPATEHWVRHIQGAKFDTSWVPDPREPAMIYVWGNQWNSAVDEPTIEYHVPGATQRKYMTDRVATLPANVDGWNMLMSDTQFDRSWRPNPNDPPYIYVWGNQHWSVDIQPTVEYHTPGATERKYMTDRVATLKPTKNNWRMLIDGAQFDTSWVPDPREPAMIYVWGNQWNDAATEPTVEYHMPGATERKYMIDRVATVPETTQNWRVSNRAAWPNFDWSWRPNPHSPPQIYQWADGGPTYTVPGATDVVLMPTDHPATRKTAANTETQTSTTVPHYYIETTLEDLISEHPDEVFWALNPHLSYDSFDFNWRPSADNFQHINVFGNELSKDTQTYYINGPMLKLGYNQLNYVDKSITFDTKLDMFWVDTGSRGSDDRYEAVKARYPHIVRTRFANNWVATVNRCLRKATTDYVWILSSDYDYTGFKFDFYPAKWQSTMTHVFGTQWSHWGNTYLVNRTQFPQDTEYIEVIEHLRNINHVRSRKVVAAATKHDVLYIDFGNTSDTLEQLRKLDYKITVVTYKNSYLETIRGWVRSLGDISKRREYLVWITTSITDYTDFDWSWQCDPFQRDQVHVFASSSGSVKQKRGDTMMLNVCEFATVMDTITDLADYTKKVNYVGNVTAARLAAPTVSITNDTLNDALDQVDRSWPYTQVIISNVSQTVAEHVPEVWSASQQSVVVTSDGAASAYLPRGITDIVTKQIYDYPHIIVAPKSGKSAPLDIVFISNSEPVAEQNYAHLEKILKRDGVPNRLIRINNVDGRIASQHAAANSADTSWYFLVNGKVRVRNDFDWSWQPDRLQQAKHYIFTVTNPVNGLEYGHQAIVANNRRLTLATTQPRGLDFTLDSLHSVVDINCGVAHYNTDPWTTWRTAFREAVKLRSNTDTVSGERLKIWLDEGVGQYHEWSQRGAVDGVQFWESVGGDLQQLLNSYDWAWLRQRYVSLYGDTQ